MRTPKYHLYVNHEAYREIINALIDKKNDLIATGHYTDAIDDILSGGNFGTKDMNRYREIKYISDRSEGTVGKSGILHQGFKTMNDKVRRDYKTIGKHKALLPVGYLVEGGKYLGLLLTGKRKSSNTKQMFKEAAERKRIYSALNLFK